MSTAETWKPIPGFEGSYSVSDLGRVRGEERVVTCGCMTYTMKSKILKGSSDPYGYVQTTLHMNGLKTTRKVHVLVALAFIGERPDGMDVAHFNGVKTDNKLSNLRYCTRSENCLDKIRHGTINRGERAGGAKLSSREVMEIRSDDRPQRTIARVYGITQQTVSDIKTRRRWAWL